MSSCIGETDDISELIHYPLRFGPYAVCNTNVPTQQQHDIYYREPIPRQDSIEMATADIQLPTEPTTLNYYLELKDGGIIQTYPGTAFEKRRKHVPHQMRIQDLRSVKSQFKLEEAGFELVDWESNEKTFEDDEHVKEVYYPEVVKLMKEK